MRWGITFLAWALTGLYLADGCLDYVRVWQQPPPGYTRQRVLPHLKACGVRQAKTYAAASLGFVALYYASGWAVARLGRRRPDRPGDGPGPEASHEAD